jgi:hypothetical protein
LSSKDKDKDKDETNVPKLGRVFTAGEKPGVLVPTVFDDIYHFGLRKPNTFAGEKGMKHVCWTESIGDDAAKSSYWLPAEIDFTNGSLYEKFCETMGRSPQDVVRRPEVVKTSPFSVNK